MLTELCQELRNWFELDRRSGTFEITGGTITAPFLVEGQYFRIIGSIFNDGVHKYGDEELTDEEFKGEIWCMAIPKAVLQLAEDITAWREKYESVDSQAMSPFQSESFGGYSYSKANGSGSSSSSASTPTGWKAVFASRLNMWRKI